MTRTNRETCAQNWPCFFSKMASFPENAHKIVPENASQNCPVPWHKYQIRPFFFTRWSVFPENAKNGDVPLALRLTPLRASSDQIGTRQRRLAWPLRKDDTHKSGNVRTKLALFLLKMRTKWLSFPSKMACFGHKIVPFSSKLPCFP